MKLKKTINRIKSCVSLLLVITMLSASIPVLHFELAAEKALANNVCGMDIALVIDRSSSIGEAQLTQVKEAYKEFVDKLSSNSQTKFSLTEFGSEGKVTQGFTDDINLIKSKIDATVNGKATDQNTNWEDGLAKAQSTFDPRPGVPNIILFASDGNPNYVGDPGIWVGKTAAVNAAKNKANIIKNNGIRIISLGILGMGDGLPPSQALDEEVLKIISGPAGSNSSSYVPIVSPPTAISENSDVILSDFSTMATKLSELAGQFCTGKITAQEQIDADGDGIVDFDGSVPNSNLAGWKFEVTTEATTDSSGKLEFNVPGGTYFVAQKNTKPNMILEKANCYKNGIEVGSFNSAEKKVSGLLIAPNEKIDCVFVNKFIPAPAINVAKSANPASLPVGGGNVNYSYAVTNPGNVTLTNITLSDDKCSPVNYASGDTNTNSQLETTETWNYTCAKNITQNTTNTATVAGKYGATNVSDTDSASVTVNPPTPAPAINVAKSANPASLPVGGGSVTYLYTVTNPGNAELSNITVTDDKCGSVTFVGGDNGDNKLAINETWIYKCTANLTATMTNTATATGIYNNISVQDSDNATVTVAPPQTCTGNCGGVTLFPAIRLIKTPAPYQLPREGGVVIYTYLVSNPGYYAITDVVLTDDKCSEVKFIDGDKNTDKRLDRNEIWKYTCQTNLTATTINTATVNGKSSAGNVKDTTKATVYVPKMDLAIKLEKTANPSSLSEKGGIVTYSYKVSNKGSKAISDVTVTDDKCSPINFISGDTNKDKKLDTSEIWTYTCQSNLTKTTVNTGTARGQVDGKYATDTSEATVRVEKVLGTSIIPKGMPKTGFGGGIISGYGFEQILIVVFILLAIAIVKPRIKKRYY